MKSVLSALLLSLGLAAVALPAQADWRDRGAIHVERDGRLDADRGADRGADRREHGGPRREAFRDVLPERRIARILRRSGFVDIRDIRLRRDRYVATAVRPNGAVIRVALDARDGDILGSERIGWERGARDYERFRKGGRHGYGG
jgi:uncharacterized membrane protein YkoI